MTNAVRNLACRRSYKLKLAAFALSTVTVVTLGGGVPALAAVVYATGFEAPTYTTGPLAGQDGWAFGSGTVETTTVFAGTQAVQFNSAGVSGQSNNFRTVPSASGSVQVTDEFFVSAADPFTAFEVLALFGDNSFIGQITITNGLASFDIKSSLAITTGTWNSFAIDLNFATDQEMAFVNGTLIGTDTFSSANTALTGVEIGINSANSSSFATGYADNLSIAATPLASTPLPATLPLFAGGLGALGLLHWRRKRQAQVA